MVCITLLTCINPVQDTRGYSLRSEANEENVYKDSWESIIAQFSQLQTEHPCIFKSLLSNHGY